MGNFNSSTTRVVPVFSALLERDATGATWLNALLRLANRAEALALVPTGSRLVPDHGHRWGKGERKLPAPQSLLEYLALSVDATRVGQSKDVADVRAKRVALSARRPEAVSAALAALRSGKRGRRWFVLEGPSQPDALLETGECVVCIEGKRTEAACTTETTWMPVRSQLLRHMDAATDAFPTKAIFGLLIVEGEAPDPLRPSEHWAEECANQYAPAMVGHSLPHRSPAERSRIAGSVLGVVTWQAVCDRLNMEWPPHHDAV